MIKKLVASVSFLVVERVVRVACLLIANVILARSLGVEEFGLYMFVFSIISILLVVSCLGFDRIAVKEITRDQHCLLYTSDAADD